jgi:hypothetical protein
MAIGTTMRTAIVADGTMNALVGDRVYPLVFPAGPTFPCITYRIISGLRVGVPCDEVYVTRIQYDLWTYNYDDTEEVKAALMTFLDFRDMLVGSQRVISTQIDLTFDIFDEPAKLHRAVVDVSIRHEGA